MYHGLQCALAGSLENYANRRRIVENCGFIERPRIRRLLDAGSPVQIPHIEAGLGELDINVARARRLKDVAAHARAVRE
jgi:hypothetical protein